MPSPLDVGGRDFTGNVSDRPMLVSHVGTQVKCKHNSIDSKTLIDFWGFRKVTQQTEPKKAGTKTYNFHNEKTTRPSIGQAGPYDFKTGMKNKWITDQGKLGKRSFASPHTNRIPCNTSRSEIVSSNSCFGCMHCYELQNGKSKIHGPGFRRYSCANSVISREMKAQSAKSSFRSVIGKECCDGTSARLERKPRKNMQEKGRSQQMPNKMASMNIQETEKGTVLCINQHRANISKGLDQCRTNNTVRDTHSPREQSQNYTFGVRGIKEMTARLQRSLALNSGMFLKEKDLDALPVRPIAQPRFYTTKYGARAQKDWEELRPKTDPGNYGNTLVIYSSLPQLKKGGEVTQAGEVTVVVEEPNEPASPSLPVPPTTPVGDGTGGGLNDLRMRRASNASLSSRASSRSSRRRASVAKQKRRKSTSKGKRNKDTASSATARDEVDDPYGDLKFGTFTQIPTLDLSSLNLPDL